MTGLFSLLLIVFNLSLFGQLIDVVIPCHEKDYPILEYCVRGVRDHGEGVRRVVVVTSKRSCGKIKKMAKKCNFEIFYEENYPFTLMQVGNELKCHDNRGWFYQQLLKFYAFSVIPNLTDHIVLLDADTVFLKSCQFITEDGKTLFTPGWGGHHAYLNHARKLLPDLEENPFGLSGICNYMVMRRDVVDKIFYDVQSYHQNPFWRAFLYCVDEDWRHWVGASEYWIYFNYFLANYPREYFLQHLKWDESLTSLDCLEKYREEGYYFVTCHHWQRGKAK